MAAILGGCLEASPATRAPPGASADVDVDLHQHILNVSMPARQPTAAVQLDVTKDLWVRPIVYTGYNGDGSLAEDTSHWVLCVWAEVLGLPDDAGVSFFVFWKNGNDLTLTGHPGATRGNADNDRCVVGMAWDVVGNDIGSREPADASFVVVFTATRPSQVDLVGHGMPSPFHVRIAIATKRCDERVRDWYCPTGSDVSVDPFVRGAAAVHAYKPIPADCIECGFDLDDSRPVQPLGPGMAAFSRESLVHEGLTFFSWGSVSPVRVSVDMTTASKVTHAECTGVTNNNFIWMLVPHANGVRMEGETTATTGYLLEMLEIPVDLAELGGSVVPYAQAFSGNQVPYSEEALHLCV